MRTPCICIFAKPPRPDSVKTRLAGEVGSERAARETSRVLAPSSSAAGR